jgi:pseudaminic acid cytidylyltransferase
MNVCIIPARGGSKRIPDKNIKEFHGRPMIAWSIAAAGESGVFDRVIVSTDSDGIAAVAEEQGAEVLLRPADLADDYTTAEAVFNHLLEQLDHPEYACMLFATAPFVRPEHLRQGLERLKKTGASSAFPVTAFPYPIFRALKVNEQGSLEMFWPENRTARTQDLPEAFYDAGQFYWVDCAKFKGALYAPDAVPIHLPAHLAHDIDTPEDWLRAELMFQTLEKSG